MQKPLDPKARALLTAIAAAADPDMDSVPLEFAREQVEKGYARMRIPVKSVGAVHEIEIPGFVVNIPARVYVPYGNGPFPVIIFFHGGGWVFFHLDAYDPICTHLCDASGCIVVSVDYRLAPEHKFPAAADDCLHAVKWVNGNISRFGGDHTSLFLAGDSAGGNLAAVTAFRIRDEAGPVIKGQILIYPVTDYCEPEKKSYSDFADGFGLTKVAMKWFWDKYLETPSHGTNPNAAPLLAADLVNLPPALIIISGYDPLRDEGIAYATRLEDAGVNVTLSVYEEMIHGFISYLGILKQGKEAIEDIARWLQTHR
jgi:acetyl esterase